MLLEDEPALGGIVQQFLIGEGYICEWVKDVPEALEKVAVYEYDCVLLDLMLPSGSGLEVVKALKSQNSDCGIVILSAKGSLEDKLLGLDLGADDYLPKPFHLSELNSRLKSILRRRKFSGGNEIIFGSVCVVPASHHVSVNGSDIQLTRKEYDLLLYLLSNKNRVLTKGTICEHLYGDEIDQADTFNFLYSHIKNLRKKIMDAGSPDYIQSVYGVGYKFAEK